MTDSTPPSTVVTEPPLNEPLLRLGTRGSPLALAQAEIVRRQLAETHAELACPGAVEIVIVKTTGDREQNRRLAEIGGKGLFTKELEEALRDGRVDAAVHSMKDVPTWLPDDMILGAILEREDPRDAWFSPKAPRIEDLPLGAVVGTASLRRQAQLLARRPDLRVVNFRGNLQTRWRKLQDGEVDATMLAVAGLRRLGWMDRASALLEPEEILPAVGQGAIGIELRAEDVRTRTFIAALDHAESSLCVHAERACLDVLDGSCRTPIGALARLEDEGRRFRIEALVATPEGDCLYRAQRVGRPEQAEGLSRELGHSLRKAAGEAFFEALKDLF